MEAMTAVGDRPLNKDTETHLFVHKKGYRVGLAPIAGADGRTITELENRNTEIKVRLQEMDRDRTGAILTDDEKREWNDLSQEIVLNEEAIEEGLKRKEWLEDLSSRTESREAGATFGVRAPRSQTGREDIWDMTTLRTHFSTPEEAAAEALDRSKRAIEDFHFPHPDVRTGMVTTEDVRSHLERIVSTVATESGAAARYILEAGSPQYARAFGKLVMHGPQALNSEETRALAVGTGSTGGYAVPITLDPTLIPTSNGTVNPMRQVARIETIVGLEYRGLTAGAITASYGPEAMQASDNSPTLAQPDVFVEKAQAFVPYSIEIGMDWNGLQAGLAKLIGDAKDVLEATKFTLGAGHSSNEPSGLLTGATNTVATTTSATFAIADLYKLEQALPPRFRPMGQFFGNRAVYNLIRQFGQNANQNLWMAVYGSDGSSLAQGLANRPFGEGGNLGQKLIGYGTNEVSDMVSTTTAGSSILAIGDPSYYLIVDRIGMSVEVIPHLFGSQQRPTGQRGLYAYWRNTGTVVDPNAWRVLTA